MTIQWKDRPGFIELAAQALQAGDTWGEVMEQLPEYGDSYTDKDKHNPKPGYNQQRLLMVHIERRRMEIKRGVEVNDSDLQFMQRGWPHHRSIHKKGAGLSGM